jgi:multiple sugar transport system permease protein
MAADAAAVRSRPRRRRRSVARLTGGDRLAVALMVGVPLAFVVGFIWFPTLASVYLSFTSWDGIGGINTIEWIGLTNYQQIVEIYPPFWPAFRHNIIWLVFLALVPTTLGMLLAYLLDKQLRGSRIYQSVFFLPVVISLAIVGFIWQLVYAPEQGLINNILGTNEQGNLINWLGDPNINLWAVLVAAAWRHAGYIMILYLAGLKSVDRSLREAAAIDGASEWYAFRTVVFPAMRPINIVVVVITVIEALRAFDIVYVINRGRNGLELLSVLVTDNIVGEASRIGYGSALAVILFVISIVPICVFLATAFKEQQQ